MSRLNKILSLLLCMVMVLTCIPVIQAEETGNPPATGEIAVTPKAPERDHPCCDLLEPQVDPIVIRELPERQPTKAVTYHTTEDAAAAQMRAAMVKRTEQIVIYYKTNTMTQSFVDYIYPEIFQRAVAHTGVSYEGDAIHKDYSGYSPTLEYYKSGSYYYCTFTYGMRYKTTAAQEAELVAAIDQFIARNIQSGMTSYQKFRVVYDWICQNITYDYEHLNDNSYALQYTAYAAMFDRTCVCQGYATLLYRMLLECGIDNRYISGIANSGSHGWNIVKMNGAYYNADSTWDAGSVWQEYEWCLDAPASFEDHARYEEFDTAEFHQQYPMGTADFWPVSVYTDKADVASQLHRLMKDRKWKFTLYIDTANKDTAQTLKTELVAMATSHTGVPDEGDYLLFNTYSTDATASYGTYQGRYMIQLHMEVVYYSDVEQEQKITEAVDSFLAQYIRSDMTDYEKFDTIYSWMSQNITYGYDGTSEGYGMAYTALYHQNAGSMGFPMLFYRLMLECGIDCRSIKGRVNNNTGNHYWNIVEIDGYFYNVDPGWEASYVQKYGAYRYRLKCDSTFTNHARNAEYTTTAFYTAYPMGQTDYTDENRFEITMSRMILGNSLEFQFAVPQSSMADWTGAYAVVQRAGADGTTTLNVPVSAWTSVTANGTPHWAIIYDSLAAKEMADTFRITIYNSSGKAVSKTKKDSVRDYVQRAFNTQTTEGKTMMVDMLNYGAAAQQNFSYNTADLANSQLSAAQKAYATTTTPSSTDERTYSSDYMGTRLVLENRIQMQVAFRNISTDMYAVYSYTDHNGKSCSYRVNGSEFINVGSDVYGVELSALVYADARSLVTVKIYNSNGTLVAGAKDCIESYVNRSGTSGLNIALMRFTDSAYNYLH